MTPVTIRSQELPFTLVVKAADGSSFAEVPFAAEITNATAIGTPYATKLTEFASIEVHFRGVHVATLDINPILRRLYPGCAFDIAAGHLKVKVTP